MGEKITKWEKLESKLTITSPKNIQKYKLHKAKTEYWASPKNMKYGVLSIKLYLFFVGTTVSNKYNFTYQVDYSIFPYVDNNVIHQDANLVGFSTVLKACWDSVFEILELELVLSQQEKESVYTELSKNVSLHSIAPIKDYSLNEPE